MLFRNSFLSKLHHFPQNCSCFSSSSPSVDHYEVLGIKRNASIREIQTSYRKLAKIYHPDKYQGSDKERFKLIQNAYEVLKSTKLRKEFDDSLSTGKPKSGPSFPSEKPGSNESSHSQDMYYSFKRDKPKKKYQKWDFKEEAKEFWAKEEINKDKEQFAKEAQESWSSNYEEEPKEEFKEKYSEKDNETIEKEFKEFMGAKRVSKPENIQVAEDTFVRQLSEEEKARKDFVDKKNNEVLYSMMFGHQAGYEATLKENIGLLNKKAKQTDEEVKKRKLWFEHFETAVLNAIKVAIVAVSFIALTVFMQQRSEINEKVNRISKKMYQIHVKEQEEDVKSRFVYEEGENGKK